jgi:hypothetical protein
MDGSSFNLELFRELEKLRSSSKPSVNPTPAVDNTPPTFELNSFRALAELPPLPFPPPGDIKTKIRDQIEMVKSLRNEGHTYRQIEAETRIPKSTVSDFVNHPDLRHGETGRIPYLNTPADSQLYLKKLSERALDHHPAPAKEAAKIAGEILSKPGMPPIHPSPKWAIDFAHNHPDDMSFLVPKSLESVRAKVDDPDILVTWHDRIAQEADPKSVPSFLTYNMDEFKAEYSSNKKVRVMITRDILNHSASKVLEKGDPGEHITICLISCPDPETCRILRHVCILPLTYFPPSFEDLQDTFDFTGNPNTGWTNQVIFGLFVDSFVAQVNRIRAAHGLEELSPLARALLYLDGDESRRNPEALEKLKAHNITAVGLVAHATTRTQPDDMGLIGSIKQKSAHLNPKYVEVPTGMTEAMTKRLRVLSTIRLAIKETYSVGPRIKRAWAQSSLFPFERSVLFSTQEQATNPLDSSKFDALLVKSKGKKTRIAGRLLTSDSVIISLKEEKARSNKEKLLLVAENVDPPKRKQKRKSHVPTTPRSSSPSSEDEKDSSSEISSDVSSASELPFKASHSISSQRQVPKRRRPSIDSESVESEIEKQAETRVETAKEIAENPRFKKRKQEAEELEAIRKEAEEKRRQKQRALREELLNTGQYDDRRSAKGKKD